MKNKGKNIPDGTKWLMLATAILFDIISLLSLVPFVGWVLEIFIWLIAAMTFWIWFMMYDVNIYSLGNPKKFVANIATNIIELTPFGFIPTWSILILYLTRAEKLIEKTVGQIPGGEKALSSIEKMAKK
jgi:uncharacterized membrane protein